MEKPEQDLWNLVDARAATEVYRGAEIVARAGGGFDVWWLPLSGKSGRLASGVSRLDAVRAVDAVLGPAAQIFKKF